MDNLQRGMVMLYARILSRTDTYEVCEIRLRTIEDTWFTGCDTRSQTTYIFNRDQIDKTVFLNRSDALSVVKSTENNKTKET